VSRAFRHIRQPNADVAMMLMVFVWGFHFIVMKDGFSGVAPLTYNAVRFMVALPLILLLMARQPALRCFPSMPQRGLLAIAMIGPLGFQVGLAWGLARTTSTNSALLVATMPAWTALISIGLGQVATSRQILAGLALAFGGVTLVVLSRAGADLSLSTDDLVGSLLLLGAALAVAFESIASKPLVDRHGGMTVAVWKYLATLVGLLVLASPDLLRFSPDVLPADRIPHILYSALAAVTGFVVMNYAVGKIGPTRTTAYFNLNPIVAAVAGIVALGEPLTVSLVIGGVMTLWGVRVVRHAAQPRPPVVALGQPA
jgi:O-acetylserine/cysteine efflux transporter